MKLAACTSYNTTTSSKAPNSVPKSGFQNERNCTETALYTNSIPRLSRISSPRRIFFRSQQPLSNKSSGSWEKQTKIKPKKVHKTEQPHPSRTWKSHTNRSSRQPGHRPTHPQGSKLRIRFPAVHSRKKRISNVTTLYTDSPSIPPGFLTEKDSSSNTTTSSLD